MSNADDNIRKAANEERAQLAGIFDATRLAEMKQVCKSMHELYKSFLEAGFDRQQAMQMTIAMMQIANGGGKEKANE